MAIEVTVRDTETGETQTAIVEDYIILTADPCYMSARTAHRNGTHVLTVKNAAKPAYTLSVQFEPPRGAERAEVGA